MSHGHTHPPTDSSGFTLIEILVVLGLIAVLFGLSAINLSQPQTSASLDRTLNALLADIKSQQTLAMSGDNSGTASQQPHGIYLQADHFTLFAGSSYDSGDSHNFAENVASSVSLATNLPSNTLLFAKGTGEVNGFTPGDNTITLTSGDQIRTITINRLGAMAVE
jgi:prepilin-type N-terminal cleavage/methylation domain-containing protein